jgi:hypothetical protein
MFSRAKPPPALPTHHKLLQREKIWQLKAALVVAGVGGALLLACLGLCSSREQPAREQPAATPPPAAAVAMPPYLQWLASAHAAIEPQRTRSFVRIFNTNSWNAGGAQAAETRAGPGSTIKYTANVRQFLGDFIRTQNIATMADVSCSEMLWQPLIPGFNELGQFAGYDIVPRAIAAAKQRVQDVMGGPLEPRFSLEVRDMVREALPRPFDLVIVRDTLFHLPITDALMALSLINASGSKYIGTTTLDSDSVHNMFITPGEWYPLSA